MCDKAMNLEKATTHRRRPASSAFPGRSSPHTPDTLRTESSRCVTVVERLPPRCTLTSTHITRHAEIRGRAQQSSRSSTTNTRKMVDRGGHVAGVTVMARKILAETSVGYRSNWYSVNFAWSSLDKPSHHRIVNYDKCVILIKITWISSESCYFSKKITAERISINSEPRQRSFQIFVTIAWSSLEKLSHIHATELYYSR